MNITHELFNKVGARVCLYRRWLDMCKESSRCGFMARSFPKISLQGFIASLVVEFSVGVMLATTPEIDAKPQQINL
jgi:hypothetical protein